MKPNLGNKTRDGDWPNRGKRSFIIKNQVNRNLKIAKSQTTKDPIQKLENTITYTVQKIAKIFPE